VSTGPGQLHAEAWDIAFGGMPHDAYISAFDDVPFGDGGHPELVGDLGLGVAAGK
jgi:hypothetical protein